MCCTDEFRMLPEDCVLPRRFSVYISEAAGSVSTFEWQITQARPREEGSWLEGRQDWRHRLSFMESDS